MKTRKISEGPVGSSALFGVAGFLVLGLGVHLRSDAVLLVGFLIGSAGSMWLRIGGDEEHGELGQAVAAIGDGQREGDGDDDLGGI